MGRKICLAFLCVLVIGMAAGVRAQENLDTLWTQTIGGAGNDVFYAMAKGNDGNVLIAISVNNEKHVLFLSPEGNSSSVLLTGMSPNIGITDVRQTQLGDLEVVSRNSFRRYDLNGNLLETVAMGGEFFSEGTGWFEGLGFASTEFWSDTTLAIVGWHQTGNLGQHGQWNIQIHPILRSYSLPTGIQTEIGNYAGGILRNSCFCRWYSSFNGENHCVITRDCGSTNESIDVNVGLLYLYWSAFQIVADADNYPWLVTPGRPFVAIHMRQSDQYTSIVRTDNDVSNTVAFAVDSSSNLVCLAYATLARPWRGIKFDIVDSESGTFREALNVPALSNVIPKNFMLLDDNTAITVSTVGSGTTQDLLIARTDTIPSGYYAPQPASVELLVEGPPAWGYRIHSGSYSQNQITFQNLCNEARGNTSGGASARWESGLANFMVFFTADHAIPTNSASDTLWLTAPECESVDIAWSMNGVDGVTKGPFHPEVNLQTFSCQLEPFGVNARFDIAGATNIDSIQVWRKNATETDSLKIETRYAVAGHHVVADHNVPVGITWTYYLLAADRFGRLWSLPNASATIFVDPAVIVPDDYQLALPYPNPFNASTTFSFDIPELATVHLDIYDITGRLVTTLMDQSAPAGSYTKTFDASEFASGVYLYSFSANDFQKHGKILLLK